MMEEICTQVTRSSDAFAKLNAPIAGGVIHVTPDNKFGVKVDDNRVIAFGEGGALDVTEFSVPVCRVETRTQNKTMKKGDLFVFDGNLYQTISDDEATINAYSFKGKTVVTLSPERLPNFGNVRAIGVVFMPEAQAFGGNVFNALKTLAAASNDRQTLYDLRRKESLWTQNNGKPEPNYDGLDEVLVFSSNPGMTQFQSLMQLQRQSDSLAALTRAVQTLSHALAKNLIKSEASADEADDVPEDKPSSFSN